MSRHPSRFSVLLSAVSLALCAACVSVARAQDVPAPDPQPTPYLALEGQPPSYRPYAPLDYFVWHDGAGWHLRATTSGHYHSFSGVIRAQEGVNDVRPLDPSISLQLGQNQIQFAFAVAGGEKGFDWQSPGAGCAQYNLLIDGQDRPGKVTVGYSQGHPGFGGFQLCAGGEAAPVEVATAQGPEMDPDGFQTALSPYGQWVNMPGYGLVWQPYAAVVGPNFQPYGTEGHWVYTNAGWLWASGYSWGWAPFHYGNWVYASSGWCWIPGRVWAPAWVTWRSGGGYVGWAPMGPPGVTVVSAPTYVYVQNNNFTSTNVHEHYVVGVQAQSTIYERTQPLPSAQVVNGHPIAPVNAGPQPTVISEATGHPVSAVPVHEVTASVPPASTPGVHYASGATAQHPVAVAPLPPATARQFVAATHASGAAMQSTSPSQGGHAATPVGSNNPAAAHAVTSPSAMPTHNVAPAEGSMPAHNISPAEGSMNAHPSSAETVQHAEPAAAPAAHATTAVTPAHSVQPATKAKPKPPPKEHK